MFGYLTPYKKQLSEEDAQSYQSYYCGLCETLGSHFGAKSELILQYDLVFLAILYNALYEEDDPVHSRICPVKMKKKDRKQAPSLHYAADMNLLLAYHNYRDRAMDSGSKAAKAAVKSLKKEYEKTADAYPRQKEAVEKYMKKLAAWEKEPGDNPDEAANYTGEMLQEVFLLKEDEFSRYLRPMFFSLGKFIYLIDAFCDVFEDEKTGNYNPYASYAHDEDLEEKVRRHLESVMSDCASYFEMLPIFKYRDILRNIIYSGVWSAFYAAVKKRREE